MTDTERDYAAVVDALRGDAPLLVATHENPDGDAIGSLAGAVLALRTGGRDVLGIVAGLETVPREYRFLLPDGVVADLPADAGERVLLALDCGSERRLAPPAVLTACARVVNVDHHHDNTRFGDVNVVDADAACTTLMLGTVLRGLGIAWSHPVATALYVGLVTDTGRFQYANTDARAHTFAADLIDVGIDPATVFRRVYEDIEAARVRLHGRVLARLELRACGRLAVAVATRADFAAAEADDALADGIVDQLRAIEGVAVGAFVRESANGTPRHKISLRAASDEIDVSRIARSFGGGGHRQAAGCSSDLDAPEIVATIEREVAGGP